MGSTGIGQSVLVLDQKLLRVKQLGSSKIKHLIKLTQEKLNKSCPNHNLPLMHMNKVTKWIYGGNNQVYTHSIGIIGSDRG